jgi:hypothetical protein
MSFDHHDPEHDQRFTQVSDPEAPPDAFAALVDKARVTVGYDAIEDDAAADDIVAGRALRWTSRTILVAALFLLVFNARSLVTWSTTLPPNWATATIRDLSNVWEKRMTEAGLTAPRDAIHTGYESLKAPPRRP